LLLTIPADKKVPNITPKNIKIMFNIVKKNPIDLSFSFDKYTDKKSDPADEPPIIYSKASTAAVMIP
jgi:hypothetical protein